LTSPPSHKRFCTKIGAIAQLGERLHGMQEVGGSIPPGSTSLRRFAATTGKPAYASESSREAGAVKAAKTARRSPQGEDGLVVFCSALLLLSPFTA
jgi:hypothetical protein